MVSYSGEIREDAFFNMLHAEKFQIAGLDVDINPISMEKPGTLGRVVFRDVISSRCDYF